MHSVMTAPSSDEAMTACLGDAARTGFPDTQEPLYEYDIGEHDWCQPGPVLLHVFHGTTHDFENFSLERAHHEAQFGNVLYFTSSRDDAQVNYATPEGPDLKNRVEREAERLNDAILDDPEAFGLSEDADGEEIAAKADALARARHVGPTSRIIETRLLLKKPFVIDEAGHVRVPLFEQDSCYDRACREVAEEEGIDPDDLDTEEHDDAIWEKTDEFRQNRIQKVSDALREVSGRLAYEHAEPDFWEDDLDEMSCNGFEKLFRDCQNFQMLQNEEGDLVSGSVFAGLLAKMGYDSIILLNADRRFRSMEMNPGTTHIHLMKPSPDTILGL